MSININTKFGEIVTSQAINEKVATIFGGNALIKGFDVTVKDNVVSVSPGECCICGASIEETDEKTLELEDLLLLNKNIIVVLSYNHKEYDFSYRLALESSVSDNELIVATLIVENSLIKNIIDVEKVATLIELNEIERTISENISSAQHLEYQGKNLTCVETNNSKTENISIKGDSKKLGSGISSVGSYGNTLKIRSHGKNLFNKNQTPENIVGFGDNVRMFRVRENVSYAYSSNPYVGQVTFRFFDCNNLHLSQITVSSGESLISPKNSFFAKVHTDMDSDVQIEEGNVVTEYEHFQEHIVEISLPMEGGLKALPSGVCDEITKDGDIVQRVDRVIFNGTENWTLLRDDSLVTFYLDFEETTSDPNQEVISNKFSSFGFNQNIESIYCDNKRVYITMAKDIVANNNVVGFKLWLEENNVEMLFEIDHAGDVRVENINIHTFKGVNNVTTDCAIKPMILLNNQEGESLTFNCSKDSYTDNLKIKGSSVGGINDENIILDKIELPIFKGTSNVVQDNKIVGNINFRVGSESKSGSGSLKIESSQNSKTSSISIKGKTLYKQTHCKFEEGFNIKFDDKYPTQSSEITKEIVEARSDYFGKEHPTLKDKEDSEFEFVHIDNSKGMFMPVSSNDGGIKVENSIEGKTKDLTVKGRTLQNLIDPNSILGINQEDKTLTTEANSTARTFPYDSLTSLNDGKIYTIILNVIENTLENQQGFEITSVFYGWDKTVRVNGTGIFKAVVKRKDGNATRFYLGAGSGVIKIKDFMILEGDWTNKEIPSYLEGIKSLGEEENKISILSTGKNLTFEDKNNPDKNYESSGGGTNVIQYSQDENAFYTTTHRTRKFVNLKPNTKYTFSIDMKIRENKTSYQILHHYAVGGGTLNIGKDISSDWNRFSGVIQTNSRGEFGYTVYSLFFRNTQLEEGTTSTPYTPPQSDKKDILLPVQDGAKGLPNGVCDEVMANGDYLQRVERIVFNGSESWGGYRQDANIIGFKVYIANAKLESHKSISDRFKTITGGISAATEECLMVGAGGGDCYILVSKSKLETQDLVGFKKWLQANPTTVYYELKTPILHKANPVQNNNLTTFKDITHITTTNKIQGLISGYKPVPETYTEAFDSNFINELESTGDNEENKITISSCGKNLIILPDNFERSVIDGRSVILVNNFIYKIPFTANTRYTIKFTSRYCAGFSTKIIFNYTDGTKTESYWSTKVFSDYTLVSEKDKTLLNVEFKQNTNLNSIVSGAYDENIFLYEGAEATAYEAPIQFKKNISLPVTGGVKRIGDSTDKLLGNGDYLQIINRSVIDGTERLSSITNPEGHLYRRFYFHTSSIAKSSSKVLSNKFLHGNSAASSTECISVDVSGNTVISILASRLPIDSHVGFKDLLKQWSDEGQPLVIFYELKTPILHKATSESIENTKINLPPQFSHFNAIDSAAKKESGAISLTNTGSSRDEIKLLTAPVDGLKSVSDSSADEILTDGSIDKNIDRIILNGTEEWESEDENVEFRVFFTQNNKATDNYNDVVLCDRFPSLGYIKYKENIFVDNKRIYIVIHESKLTSSDVIGFKAWLASNNTEVLFKYDKSESIREENLNLHTFAGITRISQDSNVSGNIVAEVSLSNGESQSISSSNIAINDCATGITNNLKVMGNTKYKQTHCKFEEGFNVKFDDKYPEQASEITQQVEDAKNGKETLRLELVDMENRMVDNIAKQYLPVSSDSGNLKVENCYNGLTKDLTVKGRTLQNLFKPDVVQNVGTSIACNNVIKSLFSAGTYTLVNNTSKSVIYGIFSINENKWLREIKTSISKDITLADNEYVKNVTGLDDAWQQTDSEKELFKKALIVLKGNQSVESLTYFEGIKSLGEEENKISILSTTKNLYSIENSDIKINHQVNSIKNGDVITVTGDSQSGVHYVELLGLNLKAGKKYYLGYSMEKDSAGGYVVAWNRDTWIDACSMNTVFHPINNTDINFACYVNQNQTIKFKIWVIESSNVEPYAPHKQDKKDISLPVGVTHGGKGIENVCDKAYWNGDYLQKVGRVVLDETIILYYYRNNKCVHVKNNIINNGNSSVICNKFNGVESLVEIIGKDTIGMTSYNDGNSVSKGFYINFDKDVSLEEVRSLLLDTPTIIYYKLAEPILHKATTPVNNNLTTFKDITHIATTNKIQGLVSGYRPIPATYTDSFDSNFINEIESVGDSTENKINISSIGKNLFNVNSECVLINGERYSDGIKQKNEGSLMPVFKISGLDIGKSYVITCNIDHLKEPIIGNLYYCVQYKNGYYSAVDKVSNSGLSTSPNGLLNVEFKALQKEVFVVGSTTQNYFYNIQLEEGSISTLYENCQQDKKAISLPVENGCKSLPNGVCDELLSNGDFLQRIGVHIENGTSKWACNSEKEFTKQFFNTNLAGKVKHLTRVFCNRYPIADTGKADYPCAAVLGGLDNAPIRIREDRNKTTEQLNDELRENHVVFYYELAEPILHKNPNNTELNKESYEVV